jgi:hypothetical protein
MKNIFLVIWDIVKKLFIFNSVLPPRKSKEDIEFLYEIQDKIKNFRLDNGLMPLNYSLPLEYFVQENADHNFMNHYVSDNISESLIGMHLKLQNVYFRKFACLAIHSNGHVDDFMRLVLTNRKYRSALLDGFMTNIAVAKCENYISIIIAA